MVRSALQAGSLNNCMPEHVLKLFFLCRLWYICYVGNEKVESHCTPKIHTDIERKASVPNQRRVNFELANQECHDNVASKHHKEKLSMIGQLKKTVKTLSLETGRTPQ